MSCDVGGALATDPRTLSLSAAAILVATLLAGKAAADRYALSALGESAVAILLGLLVGLVAHLSACADPAQTRVWPASLQFEPAFFTLILLPPIIFESGYSLNHATFFKNLGAILTFAFAGTLVAWLVTAPALYFGLGGDVGLLTPMESAAFAALIVAVDPVATLAIFGKCNVNHALNSIVFGESVLNDAVAIVLFKTILQLGVETRIGIDGFTGFDARVAFGTAGAFCAIFVGSLVLGALAGALAALALKMAALRELHEPAPTEVLVLVAFSYAGFILAEYSGLSGIVSSLSCGLTCAMYARRNLSHEGQHLMATTIKTLAYLSETVVFLLIGIGFWVYTTGYFAAPPTSDDWPAVCRHPADASVIADASPLNWPLVGLTVSMCLISRVFSVFGLAALINAARPPRRRIGLNEQSMMWLSGLRGAIALALAVGFPQYTETVGRPGHGNFCHQRARIVSATLYVILLTVFVQGGATKAAIRLFGIEIKSAREEKDHKRDDLRAGVKSRWRNLVLALERSHVRPLLTARQGVAEPGVQQQRRGAAAAPSTTALELETLTHVSS